MIYTETTANIDLKTTFVPNLMADEVLNMETHLEKKLLDFPEYLEGLFWGKPRYGHPEGQVLYHIRDVLDNIERVTLSALDRERLRLVALVHDTFKYIEDRSAQRNWSQHHSVLARRFFEKISDDKVILDLLELHDEAYYAWRFHKAGCFGESERRLEKIMHHFGNDLQLFYTFFICDTSTGDKDPTPLYWFESLFVDKIKKVDFE
jgi:HD domain